MPKDRSHIKPLIAAHLRPHRRAPVKQRGSGPVFRLTTGDDASSMGSEQIARTVEPGTVMLRLDMDRFQAVHAAVVHVRSLLVDLLSTIQTIQSIQNEAGSPACVTTIQASIDHRISELDRFVLGAVLGDQQIVGGEHTLNFEDIHGQTLLLKIPGMSSVQLGNEQIGGHLAELKTDGTAAIVNGDLVKSLSIAKCAYLQVDGVYHDLERYLHDLTEGAEACIDVADANQRSSDAAHDDVSFAHEISQLTQLDVLAQMQNRMPTAGSAAANPFLIIHPES